MRPIDGDALKGKLKKHHDFCVNAWGGFKNLPPNDKARVDEISSCIAEIVNAPTIEPYGTWIPCSERLPECEWGSETGALMFQLKDSGYIEVGFFGTGSMWRDKYFRTYTNLHGYDASSVIAWMPLPEPYREEKKDERSQ